MSTHMRRVSVVAILGLVLALFAWMLPGNASAVSEEPSGPQVAAVAESQEASDVAEPDETVSEDVAPVEAQPAEEVAAEHPAPAVEPADSPVAEVADEPVREQPANEEPVEDDFVASNPDHLPEGYVAPEFTGIDYNVYPATDFASNMKPRAVRMARSVEDPVIGEDHPQDPGDVLLFKQAKPVDGMLNTWDVTLRVEGKDIPSTSDVVLVIDTSGSMNRFGRMQAAKNAANAFVDKLLPSENTRIGVVSFESVVQIRQALTNNANALKGAINGLQANGGTFTQGGVRQAQAMLENSSADHKHIVLLSDGVPTFSYEMSNPDGYLQDYGPRDFETTAAAPRDAYTDTRVGDGTDLRYQYKHSGGLFPRPPYYYYNHGNSAIAEAGFAGTAGSNVWTVGLQTDSIGNGILNDMTKGVGTFTEVTNVEQLTPVFEQIAGAIASAVKDARVNDPMGTGFEIPTANVDAITSVPENTFEINDENSHITWNPGTLTTPIEEGSDIKYAELKYRVSINDDILNAEAADGKYPTNGDAKIAYVDAYGVSQTASFPVPYVNPTLYTVQKILLDENGNTVQENENFNVNVNGPGFNQDNPYQRQLVLNPSDVAKRVITDLRITGKYTVAEEEDSDYTTTYKMNGVPVDQVTFIAEEGDDHEIVVINKPASGQLAITKQLAGDATEMAQELTYTGTYRCALGNEDNVTAEGTWKVTGEDAAMLTPNAEGADAADTVDVKVNSTCVIAEDLVVIDESKAKFYTVGDVSIEQPDKIVKNQTSTATVKNTLNKNLGSVAWNKVGEEGSDLIGGSEWILKGPGLAEDGKPVQDVNDDGKFGVDEGLINLEWGEYTLVETLAPAGYIVDKTEHKFTIGDLEGTDGLNIDLGDITNTKVDGPTIPLTGGISRDAFLLGGGMFIALGLLVYGAYAIRRRAN